MRTILFCNIVNSLHNTFNDDDDDVGDDILFGLLFPSRFLILLYRIFNICIVLSATLELCMKLTFDFDMAYDAFMIL